MAYLIGGSNGEANGFEKNISNFALQALHESTGLVNSTTVVRPNQGNVYEVPLIAPITFQDHTDTDAPNGNVTVQNPSFGQGSVTATPTYASTQFSAFYEATTAFQLAATLGNELGQSFAEKVDQRVAASFKGFKLTAGDTSYATSADGFTRVSAIGALTLLATGTTTADSTASVLELIRKVKQKWSTARLPGNPVLVLDNNGVLAAGSSQTRLLGELTGGAVSQSGGASLSMLGEELLRTGMIQNIYGVSVVFTSFLSKNSADLVGAFYGADALYTVIKQDLSLKTGVIPGGIHNWLTGLGYFGAGVVDQRRGGAVIIRQS